jgi:hypothetical protein
MRVVCSAFLTILVGVFVKFDLLVVQKKIHLNVKMCIFSHL